MKEYSYFRADGLSLAALDTIKESKEEYDALRRKLCDRFGANEVMAGYDPITGHMSFLAFHFRANQKVPEGWKTINEQKSKDGALQCTFAMPAAGSPDAFHMANIGGLMERAARLTDLEGVFGCRMEPRAYPAGTFETAFVRQSFMTNGPGPIGKLYGQSLGIGGSGSPGTASDPIVSMEINGEVYIRVPNKPGTEEPQMLPPDAAPVSYDEMIRTDKAEYDRRMGQSLQSRGWGCF